MVRLASASVLALSLLATSGVQAAALLPPNPRFVVVGDTVLVLAPPKPVTQGRLNEVVWSSGGRYAILVAIRTDSLLPGDAGPRETALVLWDHRQRRAREIWT